MESNYKRIGDYITQVDERNADFSVSNLIGVSISKNFMESVANTIGTDLSKYKVIRKGQFACSLMQVSRDGGIAISLYREDEPAIMSPAYYIFEVKGDELLAEYLELIVYNPIFDREAVFNAIGGVRGTLSWDEFCEMNINIPSLKEQQKIVRQHKTITDRIGLLEKINNKLTELAKIEIKEELKKEATELLISDFCKDTSSGGTPSRSHPEYYGGNINWLKSGEVHNNIVVDVEEQITQKGLEKSSAKLFPKDTVLMAMYGVTAGQVGYLNVESTTNQAICAMFCKDKFDSAFLYFSLLIKQEEFERQATGGAQQNLSQDIIKNNMIKITDKYRDLHCDVFMGNIIYNSIEIAKLNRIKESVSRRL